MHNSKSIQFFIDKVTKEAEKEAQKVFDKYEKELLQRVQNQLKDGDTVWVANGTASIENKNGDDIAETFCEVLGQSQYWNENISAGFSLPYIFNKKEVIEQ